MRLLRALGIRRWDWRTCWREGDFWLCMATLLLPFGFVLGQQSLLTGFFGLFAFLLQLGHCRDPALAAA